MVLGIFAIQASKWLISSSPQLIQFKDHSSLTVDKSYHPFLISTNKSYIMFKKNCCCKKPRILNRMLDLFKQEFIVDHFCHIVFMQFTKCNLIGCLKSQRHHVNTAKSAQEQTREKSDTWLAKMGTIPSWTNQG